MTPAARPQTIQIFLPLGDPRGIRIAEITTRIVQLSDRCIGGGARGGVKRVDGQEGSPWGEVERCEAWRHFQLR